MGAEALGFGSEFGTIEPGKRAALLAVRVPAGSRMWKNIWSAESRHPELAWLD